MVQETAPRDDEVFINDSEKKSDTLSCSTVLRLENESNGAGSKLHVNKKLDRRIHKHRELKIQLAATAAQQNDRASLASSLSHLNGSGHEDDESKRLLAFPQAITAPLPEDKPTTTTMMSNGAVANGVVQHHEPPAVAETKPQKDVCLIQESPYYIHKIAQTERLDEFKRLFFQDPSRALLRDNKSWLPIHYSVFKNKVKIIDFIIENSEPSMINQTDPTGNTLLHIAIEKGHKEAFSFLLEKGADTNLLNKDSHAPIHQCVLSDKPELLDIMLSFDSVNIHLGGENGSTALHYCAYHDNLECAKVLIKHEANLCKPCNNGFFPIHTAAQRCSNRVLEFLIEQAGKICNSRLNMLSFVDGDNNKPLHAAVQFSNLGAVRLCLDNGASIDELIDVDQSTPVHVACAQGSLEILRLMAEKQSDLFLEVLHTTDVLGMTPLHKAAMFEHVEVAQFLLEKGAYIDALDVEKRSPMLLAASRNCVKMVCFLIGQGASIRMKDSRMRNLIHLIIDQEASNKLSESRVDLADLATKPCPTANDGSRTILGKQTTLTNLELVTEELLKKESYVELLNEKDMHGCTVLHYACRLGYTHCLKLLIKHGACVNVKNNDKQLPLHFAAKYGRYSSCLQLLNSQNFKNYVNEKDSNGLTALHLAAQNGHSRVLMMLMKKGALIYKSFSGNNPFHEAALNGSTSCMKIIYSIDAHVLNAVNKEGNTALHLAALEGHANVIEYLLTCGAEFKMNKQQQTFMDVAIKYKQQTALMTVLSHERWEEAMDLHSIEFKTPFTGIIQMSSEVAQAVMERCVTKNQVHDSNSCEKIFTVRYNFKYLNWSEEKMDSAGNVEFSPMVPLVTMVEFGRSDCLSHPLCEQLLERKWNRYGLPLYALSTFFYFTFLMTLTLIVVTHPSCIHRGEGDAHWHMNMSLCTDDILRDATYYQMFKENYIYNLLAGFCILVSILTIIKEVIQFTIEKVGYFKNFQVYIQLVLYPSTIIFTLPFLLGVEVSYHFQWEAGSIAIFTAWFNLLLYMQRFYFFGIFVVMFTEILKTLFKVIFLFSILIIGFGLVFYILLINQDSKANSTPAISIFRTIIMLLGETDGLNSFIIPYTHNSKHKLHFGWISMAFLCVFIFLIPILLTNLLIGLAVGDIESVRKNAKLKREAMQVQLHVDLERKMPRTLFNKVNEMEHVVFFGRNCTEANFFEKLIGKFKKLDNFVDTIPEDTNHLLYIEVLKQKQKMNLLKTNLDRQTDMIKQLLKKMDIKIESECDPNNERNLMNDIDLRTKRGLWKNSMSSSSTPALRAIVLKQLVAHSSEYDNDHSNYS